LRSSSAYDRWKKQGVLMSFKPEGWEDGSTNEW
jgi:hypothetical protein